MNERTRALLHRPLQLLRLGQPVQHDRRRRRGRPRWVRFREPVIRNDATLGVQHNFTPRLAGNLAFSHRLFETDLPRRSDNMVYGGNTNLAVHAELPASSWEAVRRCTYQDFEASNDGSLRRVRPSSSTCTRPGRWTMDETHDVRADRRPDLRRHQPGRRRRRVVSERSRCVPYVRRPTQDVVRVRARALRIGRTVNRCSRECRAGSRPTCRRRPRRPTSTTSRLASGAYRRCAATRRRIRLDLDVLRRGRAEQALVARGWSRRSPTGAPTAPPRVREAPPSIW